jgi:ABC-type polysaccharide/polyol phosphate transport system ATPase subunit
VTLAVEVEGVSKRFRIPLDRSTTLKYRLTHLRSSRRYQDLYALRDVTMRIPFGSFTGIIGANGCGKSTLLKVLAGIYQPTTGRVSVNAPVSPFLELGVGFNPELTARDNVFVNAIMLGLSRKQVEQRYDAIVAFAELEEFMELKLKNYSSGMQVRLAFAVAIQVDADILLIDEVLAVGDASFQQKCFGEFDRLKSSGKTIVFVTHDMASVERFCDRAMLLERGRAVDVGEPASIARHYNELNFRRMRREAQEFGGPQTLKEAPVAELTRARFEDGNGEQQFEAMQRDPCWVRLDVYFHAEAVDPIFAIALIDDRGGTAFAASTQITYGPTGRFRAGTTAVVRIRFENWLTPGRYRLTASVARDEVRPEAYDARLEISSLIVHGRRPGGGMVDLPHTFEIS